MADTASSDSGHLASMRPVDPHDYLGDDAPRPPLRRRILAWALPAAVGVAVAALLPGSAVVWSWVAMAILLVVALGFSWLRGRRSRS